MSLNDPQSSPLKCVDVDEQELSWYHETRHYAPAFQEAYVHYQRTGDRAVLTTLAEGLLKFHVEHITQEFIEDRGENLNLQTDLGADSIALAEIAFAVEGLFGVYLTNEDLGKLKTLNDLGDFIERNRA